MNNPMILIAEEGERKLIRQYLPALLNETEDNVLVTGVGAINVLQSLRNLPLNTPLVNIGYAGSANFEIGSVAVVNQSLLHHPNVTYPEPVINLPTDAVTEALKNNNIMPRIAPCYSSCDFVLQSKYRDCVFDMELAYIAALGFENLQAVKIVSDNLSLHTYREFGSGVE